MSVPVTIKLNAAVFRALEVIANRQGTTVRELVGGTVERSVMLSARRAEANR